VRFLDVNVNAKNRNISKLFGVIVYILKSSVNQSMRITFVDSNFSKLMNSQFFVDFTFLFRNRIDKPCFMDTTKLESKIFFATFNAVVILSG
jgi:hypothetical protein